jgi:hypothetical protein
MILQMCGNCYDRQYGESEEASAIIFPLDASTTYGNPGTVPVVVQLQRLTSRAHRRPHEGRILLPIEGGMKKVYLARRASPPQRSAFMWLPNPCRSTAKPLQSTKQHLGCKNSYLL